VANRTIQVDNIQRNVEQTTRNIGQQLALVQSIVANNMQNNTILDEYSSKQYNDSYELVSINIEDYTIRRYLDTRQIYNAAQIIPDDIMDKAESRISDATSEVIRAEEHLRRIRGY
jgi:hypothetical protein